MEYCGPLGMPRSAFLAWDQDDQDAALTWSIRQRSTHAACGTRPEEWDPTRGGSETAYRAEFRGCLGCEVIASGQEQLPKDAPAGARVVLVRNDPGRVR